MTGEEAGRFHKVASMSIVVAGGPLSMTDTLTTKFWYYIQDEGRGQTGHGILFACALWPVKTLHQRTQDSLVSRPSPAPVFDCLQ